MKKKLFVAGVVFIVALFFMKCTTLGEPGLKLYSGGAGMLDMKLYYSYQYAFSMLDGLGSNGRYAYLRLLFIDIVFIPSFAVIHAEAIKYLVRKAMLSVKWNQLSLLAYIRGMFDITENIFLITALLYFPVKSTDFILVATIMTLSKWVVFILSLASIVLLSAIAILRRTTCKKAA